MKRLVYKILFAMVVLVAFLSDANAEQNKQKTSKSQLLLCSSEHIYGLEGLSNVGRVSPGVYRGAQPAVEGYETLKRMGVKTVIDLRTSESEKQQVEAAGMKAIAIPIEMTRKGLKDKVEQVVAIMSNPENQPVFVHCRHGQDRTGIVVAAYRLALDGWRLKEAEQEMQAFGFNDVWANFKQFIRNYRPTPGKLAKATPGSALR